MNIYIANRQGRVVASASNLLPKSNSIISDTITDDVVSGVKTLELSLLETKEIKEFAIPGNFILVGETKMSSDGFLMFQIITATHNRSEYSVSIYAEDVGMDLINRQVGSWKPTGDVTLSQAISQILGVDLGGWVVNYNVPSSMKKGSSYFDYTSEDSALSRLQSVLEKFGLEMYFSYDIKGLEAVERIINIVEHRGSRTSSHLFLYGVDVANIVERKSIEDLATSFILYGADDKLLSAFSDYSTYRNRVITPSDTDFTGTRVHSYKVSGNEVSCVDAPALWGSNIDPDGKISQVKKTEYKSAKLLISYALTELEKVIEASVTYEVTFNRIPEDVAVGDLIRIVDDRGGLFLEARLMAWEYSDTTGEFSTTLGDFSLLTSSKAESKTVPVVAESQKTIYSETMPTVSDYNEGDVWNKITINENTLVTNTYVNKDNEWNEVLLSPETVGDPNAKHISIESDSIKFWTSDTIYPVEMTSDGVEMGNSASVSFVTGNIADTELSAGLLGCSGREPTLTIQATGTMGDSTINLVADNLFHNGQPIGGSVTPITNEEIDEICVEASGYNITFSTASSFTFTFNYANGTSETAQGVGTFYGVMSFDSSYYYTGLNFAETYTFVAENPFTHDSQTVTTNSYVMRGYQISPSSNMTIVSTWDDD